MEKNLNLLDELILTLINTGKKAKQNMANMGNQTNNSETFLFFVPSSNSMAK